MKPAPRRWLVADVQPLAGFHPVVGSVLAARGYDAATAAEFLDPSASGHDPFDLPDMSAAVSVVREAIRDGQLIGVYGDYDADGVTACAMLTRALRAGGAQVLPYIPNRMTEGYGLHASALEELAAQGVSCVITVDCGTSSVDVAAGRPAGMRLIVTDHHLPLSPGDGPPHLAGADALINPKLADSRYPFDGLAGAGVAFKLVQALEEASIIPAASSADAAALAALGTVADMMPLRGENRVIVRNGLSGLDALLGIRALCEVSALTLPLCAADVAFALGPRINAAGRMEDARLALQLCLSEDPDEARDLAAQLDLQNRQRQQAVSEALVAAEAQVAEIDEDAPAIVVGDPDWPMGVVGLVAGRLTERYARPAFAVCLDPGEAKGSARSIRGVHIVRALDRASAALTRYGGHAAAAGFSLDASRFDEFRDLVSAAVTEQLGESPRERVFAIDSQISAADANPELCRNLALLEPCGQGNPEPLLAVVGARVLSASAFGADSQHARVVLSTGSAVLEAVAFYKPQLAAHLPRGRIIDAAFGLELDTWQGQDRVRARLRDIRPSRSAMPSEHISGSAVPAALSA